MQSARKTASEFVMALSRMFGVSVYSKLDSKYSRISTNAVAMEEPCDKSFVIADKYENEERKFNRSVSPYEEGSGLFSQLLMIDEQLTLSLGRCARPTTPSQKLLKKCCMCLELSGHGVPWFTLSAVLLVLYLCTGDPFYSNYGLNLLAILIMDIVVVAPLKLLFKRPRPALNRGTIPMSMSAVDSYGFPSGHASRCVALAALFCYLPPFHLRTHLWYIWAIVVSLSRVVIGRHHVLDIGAGMLAGLVIFDLVRRFGLLVGV